ncbi:hypothetical protein [Nocardioides speluncae]|uniref:hypothetical protein n=1 Tax=Nocardioides speluncae TaxID=2670337 RepID=UPI00197D960C|nr:hypothetical protein [Nocardioides speluncae]
MLVALILVCEVLFWVVIAAGLIARYLLRRPKLGAALLIAAPLVDLILLTATTIDLRNGADAHLAHTLAAVYIGVSVGFGHSMIRWADVRFAHRFGGGPTPAPKPKYGAARARREWKGWLQHLVAWSVGSGLMGLAILYVGDWDRTATFAYSIRNWGIILLIDLAISASYTFSPKEAPADAQEPAEAASVSPEERAQV